MLRPLMASFLSGALRRRCLRAFSSASLLLMDFESGAYAQHFGSEGTNDHAERKDLSQGSYAVKAQGPDGKVTWARRSKRLAPYGDNLCEGARR
jgi:hypothetical protein